MSAPHLHMWVLAGGGWDGDAEATCERCHREVKVRWGQVMPELTDSCSAILPTSGAPNVCVTCGGALPQFPAFVHDSTRTPPVSGPYCDQHAVLTGTGETHA